MAITAWGQMGLGYLMPFLAGLVPGTGACTMLAVLKTPPAVLLLSTRCGGQRHSGELGGGERVSRAGGGGGQPHTQGAGESWRGYSAPSGIMLILEWRTGAPPHAARTTLCQADARVQERTGNSALRPISHFIFLFIQPMCLPARRQVLETSLDTVMEAQSAALHQLSTLTHMVQQQHEQQQRERKELHALYMEHLDKVVSKAGAVGSGAGGSGRGRGAEADRPAPACGCTIC